MMMMKYKMRVLPEKTKKKKWINDGILMKIATTKKREKNYDNEKKVTINICGSVWDILSS